ncbi:prephenate dehydrogenase/arogenate dehydrogenase family protein [Treponema zuelzerae]|uniref:Prephenate dehydrogenase/arogenate dehydrogenase family protein n=1 Tax=Teretinema zuelzerae TaxID=156 RepID=A0AAE3JHX6_9SPIR|nr:prephenate dehydrogenase/arogenate dehydrogenase family protein [Teretinema zuelzerae]MCD1653501.1 prephenate dehydrogenase/arogenate dehydrogenase family protein [Teretinema zuelzerae]
MSKAGIIGFGRFGSFWATVLSHGYEVYGYNRSAPQNPPCPMVSLEELCALPVIFLCVPMRTVPEILAKIAPMLKPGTLVVDTCSVKMEPVRWMQEALPETVDILATHPMFGPESAKEGLSGLPLMMHPVRMNHDQYAEWSHFFSSLGIMVVEMTPEEHDRQAAMSQALTHMIGRTLNAMGVEETPIGTLWYRKLLAICKQVARDSPELFLDMQTLNPHAQSMRDSFSRAWDDVCRSLTDPDNRG